MIPSRAMSPRRARVAALLLPLLVAGPGRGEIVDRIVATIDGEPITAFELRRYAEERGADRLQEGRLLETVQRSRGRLRLLDGSTLAVVPEATDHDGTIAEVRTLLQSLSTA